MTGETPHGAPDAFFRLAFENSAIGMCLVAPDGRLLEVNQALCEILGRPAADLLARTWQELTHPDDLGADLGLVGEMLRDARQTYRLTKRYLRPDGRVVWAELSVSCVRAEDRTVEVFISQIVDVTAQVDALRTARESEARLRAVTDTAPDGIVTADLEGTITGWNAGAQALFGYAEDEVLGRPVSMLMPERYRADHPANMRRVRDTGERRVVGRVVELEAVRRDRSEFPIELSMAEWEVAGQRFVTTFIRDISDRRAAAEALAASEAEYRLLAENASDVVFRGDSEGVARWLSPSVTALVGWTPEEMTGRPFVEFVHPDDVATLRAGQAQVFAGRAAHCDVRVRTSAGGCRWMSITLRPVFGEHGEAVACAGGWRDIQAEVEAREALAASERRFRTVADYTADWEWWLAPGGDLLYMSPSCERLTGYSAEEFLADPSLLTRITHGDDREAMREHYEHSDPPDLARRSHSLQFRIVRRDGELRWIGHNCVRVLLPDGTDLGVRASNHDVTDQVLAAQQVRRLNTELERHVDERTAQLTAANEELQAFAYSISHDLRAPLRAVDGFSQLIADDYGALMEQDGRDDLQRIRAAAQKMGKLIDALLTLSRLSRADVEYEDVDLGRMAADIVADLRERDPGRRVEVSVGEGLVASADPDLMEAALSSLLDNAWKFTAGREVAHIEVGRVVVDGERAFYVRDDGAGFDPAYGHKLFRPFERLHANDVYPGTGIGLATVGRIVARMGGRCWAEGAVGEGAAFFFTLGS